MRASIAASAAAAAAAAAAERMDRGNNLEPRSLRLFYIFFSLPLSFIPTGILEIQPFQQAENYIFREPTAVIGSLCSCSHGFESHHELETLKPFLPLSHSKSITDTDTRGSITINAHGLLTGLVAVLAAGL
ncbi:hypothetical protein P175DRAFT_0553478 [Aspergillus ochraceoroseus IBT 24754]|uniref:Uncharacterized protein n=1 Tax=Aspergillus ochraceoroseus IBT 24754 TaxID=1392256 RepID=A0A2T5M6P0_9EURO|nr:uncharacterized protein P175DRAFT_0553478 [Aspergillus ochraceoroseus IBT 24754]PTU24201.1 hypothetical protein P175DRAFT_0553478 [Aspergillus ochraceoroseus IBT 24754]